MGSKLLSLVFLLPLVHAWPGGAPDGACEDFMPQHQGVEPKAEDTAQFDLKILGFSDGLIKLQVRPSQI